MNLILGMDAGDDFPEPHMGLNQKNGFARIDTKLDECAPEGAYRPEPEYREPWALKAFSHVVLAVALCFALVPVVLPALVHFVGSVS